MSFELIISEGCPINELISEGCPVRILISEGCPMGFDIEGLSYELDRRVVL